MTEAFKCDRCGEFKESNKTSAEIETTLIRGDVELCRSCIYDFKQFIKYNKELK